MRPNFEVVIEARAIADHADDKNIEVVSKAKLNEHLECDELVEASSF